VLEGPHFVNQRTSKLRVPRGQAFSLETKRTAWVRGWGVGDIGNISFPRGIRLWGLGLFVMAAIAYGWWALTSANGPVAVMRRAQSSRFGAVKLLPPWERAEKAKWFGVENIAVDDRSRSQYGRNTPFSAANIFGSTPPETVK
jgi:hypothetical protein